MLSLCLTSHNQTKEVMQSFQAIVDDPRVSEIIIIDDGSKKQSYAALQKKCEGVSKIKLFRCDKQKGARDSMILSVEKATFSRCIVFDSRNQITKEYVSGYETAYNYDTVINMPTKGMPLFDCQRFSKWLITAGNVKTFMAAYPQAGLVLTNGNYVLHKERFLALFKKFKGYGDGSLGGLGIPLMNFFWMKEGGSFLLNAGMHYIHPLAEETEQEVRQRERVLELFKLL